MYVRVCSVYIYSYIYICRANDVADMRESCHISRRVMYVRVCSVYIFLCIKHIYIAYNVADMRESCHVSRRVMACMCMCVVCIYFYTKICI